MKSLINFLCAALFLSGLPISGMEKDGLWYPRKSEEGSAAYESFPGYAEKSIDEEKIQDEEGSEEVIPKKKDKGKERCFATDSDECIPESFYSAKSLAELIRLKGWRTDEDEHISNDHADKTYAILPSDIKTICQEFKDDTIRTKRPFNHAIILTGEPGVGKTYRGFAIGKALGLRAIKIPATDLADTYQNSATAYLPHLLNLAKRAAGPIVLIIDEFDSLTDRSKSDNSREFGVIQSFFMAIDQLVYSNVLVILTTNGIDGYPDSFYSRYNGYTFAVPNPTRAARELVIEHLMNNAAYSFESKDTDKLKNYLLKLTSFQLKRSFNCRELYDLFHRAQQVANRKYELGEIPKAKSKLGEEDFKIAAREIVALRPWGISKRVASANEFCKENQALIMTGLGVFGIYWAYKVATMGIASSKEIAQTQLNAQFSLAAQQMGLQVDLYEGNQALQRELHHDSVVRHVGALLGGGCSGMGLVGAVWVGAKAGAPAGAIIDAATGFSSFGVFTVIVGAASAVGAGIGYSYSPDLYKWIVGSKK